MQASEQPGRPERFMPKREVVQTTGLSATTIWREYRAGRFPKPHPLTRNRVGWLESEVRAWMADRLHPNLTQ